MKHRSRVEREEEEEKSKSELNKKLEKQSTRLAELEKRIEKETDDDDRETMEIEAESLKQSCEQIRLELDKIEKNKKWNVDNICHVVDEKTMVNQTKEKAFDANGYAVVNDDDDVDAGNSNGPAPVDASSSSASKQTSTGASLPSPPPPPKDQKGGQNAVTQGKSEPKQMGPRESYEANSSSISVTGPNSYASFTTKHNDLLESYCYEKSLDVVKQMLLEKGSILLAEHSSSYLLLSCLEDQMNGDEDKMIVTARNSQILTNITTLASSLKQHPGNVVGPFFQKLGDGGHHKSFQEGVDLFIGKIKKRAIEKRAEMEQQEGEEEVEEVDLASIPLEERLGPGGLDPIAVFESLPKSLQDAFQTRDTQQLQDALQQMDIEDAKKYMKDCSDSGLWNPG